MKAAFADPAVELQSTLVARCRAALVAQGFADAAGRVLADGASTEDLEPPYIIVGNDLVSESEAFRDKDTRPSEILVSPRIYSSSIITGKQIAADLEARMTDAADLPAPSGYEIYRVSIDTRITRVEQTTNRTVYGQLPTFRLHLQPVTV